MSRKTCKKNLLAAGLVAFVCGTPLAWSEGPSGSLYHQPVTPGGRVAARHSWYNQELEKPRQLRQHDIITVVVLFDAQMLSEGESDRRKRANVDAILADWIKLQGLSLKPAEQTDGDPRIRAALTSQNKSESDLQTRDKLQFTIAAQVKDVRPNGTLVIEAHQQFKINEEIWEQTLSGIVRPEDISPNNQVLSKHIAELNVQKRELGAVRDGYRRTWFGKLVDQYWPF